MVDVGDIQIGLSVGDFHRIASLRVNESLSVGESPKQFPKIQFKPLN
jgi:hypothetical protein